MYKDVDGGKGGGKLAVSDVECRSCFYGFTGKLNRSAGSDPIRPGDPTPGPAGRAPTPVSSVPVVRAWGRLTATDRLMPPAG